MKLFNPAGVAPPASRYSHGAVVPANARRLLIAGQVGVGLDGRLERGFEAQSRRAWANVFAVLAHEGMTKRDLVRVTVFVTEPGWTQAYREIRDEVLGGHAPTMSYLQVAGLAHRDMLIEIEGEAVAV